jgi:signal transduction histidine kinase
VTTGDFARQAQAMPAVAAAAAGRETATFLAHDSGVLQVVSVPIWIMLEAPDILGTLSIGFSLDVDAADLFGGLTNSEIAFGVGDRILASTLDGSGWGVLAPLLARTGVSERVWLNGEEFIARTVVFPADVPIAGPQRVSLQAAAAAKAIVLRSRTERLSFLSALHRSLLFTAGIALLAASGLSYAIARTVTRPLGTITATMREMAATGDLTRRIPLTGSRRWQDEDARLLASTFNTMTDSIDRFQREAAQRERLSSLGRLSTVVAHEIRNPLMIIKAALRGLRKDGIAAAEIKAAVGDIEEEVMRLNRIVAEVLDFARPIKFDLAPAALNAICADAVKASAAEAPAVRIAFEPDPSVPAIVTDAERLRLVVVNLLTNAQHAVAARDGSPAGESSEEAPSIRISTRLQGSRAVVEVRDRGVGIAPENLSKVFDPYFTTRPTGTGLGLAISRNIVEGLRGSILVESRQGRGTTVRIVLPVA